MTGIIRGIQLFDIRLVLISSKTQVLLISVFHPTPQTNYRKLTRDSNKEYNLSEKTKQTNFTHMNSKMEYTF